MPSMDYSNLENVFVKYQFSMIWMEILLKKSLQIDIESNSTNYNHHS